MSHAGCRFAGIAVIMTADGGLFWPDAATLIVADLHLEKGSSFARRGGALLPPYDSRATLRQLGAAIDGFGARRVVCLGDSFHDATAAERLFEDDRAALRAISHRVDWIWVTGNHDPHPTAYLGGAVAIEVAIGPLVFRHIAMARGAAGEISGHYHPKASVTIAGRRISGRCFVHDDRRLILPAFGAYAGGLDVFNPAVRPLLAKQFVVQLIGRRGVYRLSSERLLPHR